MSPKRSASRDDSALATTDHKSALELLRDAPLANCALVGSGIGFLWLARYCAFHKIPTPLDLSELPMLLLAIAALGIFAMVLLQSFALFPLFVRLPIFQDGYLAFFGVASPDPTKPHASRSPESKRSSRFLRFTLIALPSFLVFLVVIKQALGTASNSIWDIVVTVLAAVGFLGLIKLLHAQGKATALLSFLAYILMAWLLLFWTLFLAEIILQSSALSLSGTPTSLQVAAVIVSWLLLTGISALLMIPGETANPIDSSKIRIGALAMLVIGVSLPLVYPRFLNAPMSMLGIGGNKTVELILGEDVDNRILLQLQLPEDSSGRTRKLKVLLDVGDRMIVRDAEDESAMAVFIDHDMIVSRRSTP